MTGDDIKKGESRHLADRFIRHLFVDSHDGRPPFRRDCIIAVEIENGQGRTMKKILKDAARFI